MPERILVVDDEEDIRKMIISMLASASSCDRQDGREALLAGNYDCREAGDGLEALKVLNSGEEFDLVLVDLVMPNLDGMALLERTKDKYPDLPVVIVTEVNDVSVALHALRNGAYDYLLKPFEREQLLATVRQALENRCLKRENDAYRTNLEALVAARTQQWKNALSDLEKAFDMTLEAFGDGLDLRDAETATHSKRVTAYTIVIAKKMGLPKDEIAVIARGAFLHDIGKMAIPDEILRKPGKLTNDEMAIMEQHCYLGYKIVSRIPFLAGAAEIIYAHHERYDGTGYPRGLKGDEIPLGARIVAVVETLDSITLDLPYRPAQSFEAARKEIERWSGRQFDPQIVKVFLEMPAGIWEDFRREITAQSQSSLRKV
jgi:putative nucleotidyltransferase with HDIG domain